MTYNGLDIYNAVISDDIDGIEFISLVELPAVEKNFVCFNQEKEPQRFTIENEEKHIITGVVMLADSPIYRRNGDYEYYITYSKETLRKMAEKCLAEGTFKNIDVMHNNKVITGINLLELYLKDSSKGIDPTFVECPEGSLIASFHITDENLWNECKNGSLLNGFSLEGFFTVEKMQINNKPNNTENKMSKISKFVKSLMKFGEMATDKGVIYFVEEEIAEGIEIYVDGETEGEKVVAEDGEYTLEDGRIVVVSDGKVAEIREVKEEEVVEEPAEEVEAEEEVVIEEPVVEEPVEDVNDERVNALEERVAELEKVVADLSERLTAIETTPAVEPVVEEFEKATEIETKNLSKSAQAAIRLFKNARKK